MAKKQKSKKKSSKKLSQTRFQKQDDKGLFSFDAIRKDVFKWGIIAGAIGGFFMVGQQDTYIWPIVGVMSVVLISNYHINKASQRIPRWHATFWAFLGVMITMFGVILIGSVIVAYLQVGGFYQ